MIRPFADTNWLAANYFTVDRQRTSAVRRFAEKWDCPWHVAAIVNLECQNLFASLAKAQSSKEWQLLQSHFGATLIAAAPGWDLVMKRTSSLISQYSHKARIGLSDLVLLGTALEDAATHLLSFDTNSNLRALASVLKLKVYPELTVEDKRRAHLFR